MDKPSLGNRPDLDPGEAFDGQELPIAAEHGVQRIEDAHWVRTDRERLSGAATPDRDARFVGEGNGEQVTVRAERNAAGSHAFAPISLHHRNGLDVPHGHPVSIPGGQEGTVGVNRDKRSSRHPERDPIVGDCGSYSGLCLRRVLPGVAKCDQGIQCEIATQLRVGFDDFLGFQGELMSLCYLGLLLSVEPGDLLGGRCVFGLSPCLGLRSGTRLGQDGLFLRLVSLNESGHGEHDAQQSGDPEAGDYTAPDAAASRFGFIARRDTVVEKFGLVRGEHDVAAGCPRLELAEPTTSEEVGGASLGRRPLGRGGAEASVED